MTHKNASKQLRLSKNLSLDNELSKLYNFGIIYKLEKSITHKDVS